MEAEISKMKVTELRDALAKRGLAKTGLKADLVDRLVKAMQQEAADVENQPPNMVVEPVAPVKKESARLRKAAAAAPEVSVPAESATPIEKVFAKAREDKQNEGVAPPSELPVVEASKAVDYFAFVNVPTLEAAIGTVCVQVNPSMTLAPAAMQLVKNHIMYFVRRIMETRDSTAIKYVSMSSLERAAQVVLGPELSEHALSEAARAVEFFNQYQDMESDSAAKTKAANLVFPVDLFHNLIINVADVPPQHIESNAEVFLAACSEYITAELLELGGNEARDEMKENIVAHDVATGIAADDELRALFAGYACPVTSVEQQMAVSNWQNQAQEFFRLLEQLPSEIVATAIKSVERQLRVLDSTLACTDLLKVFASDAANVSPVNSAEIRRLSGLVKIVESSYDRVDCRKVANCMPRHKKTVFALSCTDGSKLTFTYVNEIFDERQMEPWVEMKVEGFGAGVEVGDGIVWGNDSGNYYRLNADLLHAIQKACNCSLGDEDTVRFLLSVGECESGGGNGNVLAELENMEHHGLFGRQPAPADGGEDRSFEQMMTE
eukprot:TRINITY_DN26866_c0_g1_i1.p1 TRINITY_DN26866_c0_g1~~TRINITY_DN26866_c0_g1_i1.p1  ORF type:complete len:551 (+),score=215.71 TRINITY_DN26866_c0_g1_i1:83-1735(+)